MTKVNELYQKRMKNKDYRPAGGWSRTGPSTQALERLGATTGTLPHISSKGISERRFKGVADGRRYEEGQGWFHYFTYEEARETQAVSG